MVVGLLLVEIHFPHSRSLKDKRRELSGLKARIKSRFNAAVAEIDFHEKWQRTAVGVVTLNHDHLVVEQVLESVRKDIESHVQGEILSAETRYF
ncbi:MAG: DUF503 domain-containing protein [Acidobacteriota bacterium]|jgi:uncharacterized protein YlxP (DUF503 family)|nr:DUF503 domain-containing protein [Acidobacteriota bacterium]OQB57485.1 MAG: hypothetical protein BWX98_01465 [Candidatus Aminicenantes bacterium ADurb.Bin147]HNQ80422.1 DUF503 domain-containing protein [Candidatus Aminicenantes bacterium]MDD8009618.1 DUF503 domain-containing protein [Acidobacteriota bacterium]MDD8028453.1 DUF503 domain-containing protein [Acidobacteriota bacterium]